jgi:hypothetical protein
VELVVERFCATGRKGKEEEEDEGTFESRRELALVEGSQDL